MTASLWPTDSKISEENDNIQGGTVLCKHHLDIDFCETAAFGVPNGHLWVAAAGGKGQCGCKKSLGKGGRGCSGAAGGAPGTGLLLLVGVVVVLLVGLCRAQTPQALAGGSGGTVEAPSP